MINVLQNKQKYTEKHHIKYSLTYPKFKYIEIISKYKENLNKLMRFAQGSGWCIAGHRFADQYLSDGDFWLYLLGGRAMVAIRMIGDNKVQEIRGHHNDLKPYLDD